VSEVVLIGRDAIARRVRELAGAIVDGTPAGDAIHLVAVLKGAFMFLADLMRAMPGTVTCDFLAVSSYPDGTTTTGQVRLTKDLDHSLEGRHVVLVEDIVDTGLTLSYLQELLRARLPASLRTVCLLNKPSRRLVEVPVDYIGFDIDNHFVIGYGLDVGERARNLPDICIDAAGGASDG
jgi:hypoxanthine phosphoribosyltransferase